MLHIIAGLVLLVLGVFGVISWWAEFGFVLRGLMPILLVIGGLVAIGSGLSDSSPEDSGAESRDEDEG